MNRAGQAVARLIARALESDAEEAPAAPVATGAVASRYDRDRTVDVGAWFGRMESGDFRTYIVYIVGALVFFLALIILVR